ncbi:MAG: hypothetical protein JKX84_08540, partial [Flavobacteriales bacterium]|nr:hypothetical protein [Flavobacteriales bacterium]
IAGILFSTAIVFNACNKETETPPNPYDDIDYPTPPSLIDTLDPNSIVAIHRDILHPRCAVPGCHDGFFEPDFRTVQSASSTLVYAQIVKNSPDTAFAFRVIPYDTAQSVLHERLTNCCFVNTDDRMPQDNIGVPLETDFITRIENWIMAGAPNMFGQIAEYPNQAPQIGYCFGVDTFSIPEIIAAANLQFPLTNTGNRIDGVLYNPFIMQANTNLALIIVVEDDSTNVEDLQNNKMKFSYDPDDFSPSAPGYYEQNAQFISYPDFEVWYIQFNTDLFTPDNVVYMRYYASDDDGNSTEMPYDDMVVQIKNYWSFYILP